MVATRVRSLSLTSKICCISSCWSESSCNEYSLLIIQTLSHLTALVKLHLNLQDCTGSNSLPDLPELWFDTGYQTFGHNLQSLEIRSPIGVAHKALPAFSSPSLPVLQELRFGLFGDDEVDFKNYKKILSFITSQRKSLRQLEFEVDGNTFMSLDNPNGSITELSAISFESLRSFTFRQKQEGPLDGDDLPGLDRFFASNPQLTSVHLEPNVVGFDNLKMTQLQIPAIQHLRFTFQPTWEKFKLAPFVRPFSSTLITLQIDQHYLAHQDLRAMLEAFDTNSPIKDISLTVQVLTPSVISMFEVRVPQLDVLSIGFGFVKAYSSHDGSEVKALVSLEFWQSASTKKYHLAHCRSTLRTFIVTFQIACTSSTLRV